TRGEVVYWKRPGKDTRGYSATTGYCKGKDGTDLLAVFSTNAHPFEGPNGSRPCTCYGRFAAFALLNHDGDFKAAARELARQGYGTPRNGRGGTKAGGEAAADGNDQEADGFQVHLTDLGNARRTLERHREDLRFCHPWRSWLTWGGRRWAVDETAE